MFPPTSISNGDLKYTLLMNNDCHIVLLVVSVVVDMASVRVPSHQGRGPAYLVSGIPSPDKMFQVGGVGLCGWS